MGSSSNRHWPSMFKSKPTSYSTTTHQDHQWLTHGSNHHVLSSASHRSSPYTTSGCHEESRTPEPKPRWNPKPEQIRILESIFNSGMVNPPRDLIKRIRIQLQEYGQVGDANVFYWFQNRKSRSKYKTRHHHKSRTPPAHVTTSSSSSSSSSDKSTEFALNSPATVSVNQHHGDHQFFQEYLLSPVVQVQQPSLTPPPCTQEFYFPMMVNDDNPSNSDHVVSSTGMLFTDLMMMMMMNHQYGIPNKNSKTKGVLEEDNIIKTLIHSAPPPPPPLEVPTPDVPLAPTSTLNDVQGGIRGKLIVFINDVPFEVGSGGFNVKEAFGGGTVLIDSCGQSVATNDSGVTTHQSLKNGACYYLMRPFTHDHHAATIDHLVDF